MAPQPPPPSLDTLYSQAYLHLISCLSDIYVNHDGDDLVLPGEKDWDLASMPYNKRLKGKTGPVGVYYRQSKCRLIS